MQININNMIVDWQFQKASRYLPVRLSTVYFDGIGECMAFVVNRADGMTTDIVENPQSEIFLTVMDQCLYDEIKRDILNMDYWTPNRHYNTVTGLADGIDRKIHLDGQVF